VGQCGFLTGWAIPPSHYPLPLHFKVIDSTELIFATGGLNEINASNISAIQSIEDTLVCFSLGSLIALHCFPLLRCKKLILVAPTLSFCSTTQNRLGTPSKILTSMIREIRSGNQSTLIHFYENCALKSIPAHEYSTDMLIGGLHFLQNCQIEPFIPSEIPEIVVFHGEQDRIIPFESGHKVAEMLNARFIAVPGGHIAPLTELFTSYFTEN